MSSRSKHTVFALRTRPRASAETVKGHQRGAGRCHGRTQQRVRVTGRQGTGNRPSEAGAAVLIMFPPDYGEIDLAESGKDEKMLQRKERVPVAFSSISCQSGRVHRERPSAEKVSGETKKASARVPPQDVLLLLKFHFHLYPFISEFENNDINATTQGTSVARIRIYHV